MQTILFVLYQTEVGHNAHLFKLGCKCESVNHWAVLGSLKGWFRSSPAVRFGPDVSCRARAPQQEPFLASMLVFQRAIYPRMRDRDR